MANRRYVHPGQSQVIGRDRRDYKAMNTATAGISVAGFDTAVQQALQAIIDKDFFLETN